MDWKLKKGHPYTLQIDTVDADGEFFVHITENELWSIPEYGMITMDGESVHVSLRLSHLQPNCRVSEAVSAG